jgi:alcohol dehydrogenase class IV
MDNSLRSLGVKESDFEVLADNALKTAPWIKFHPTPLDKEAIMAIYRKSF